MKALHDKGVPMVVQPEFEAGLEMTRQALLSLHIPVIEIQNYTDAVRQELYAPLYQSLNDYPTIAQLHSAKGLLDMSWVKVSSGSTLNDRSIRELGIRSQTGVSVVGVIREAKFKPNPPADYRFAAGDLVAVIGKPDEITAFETLSRPDGNIITGGDARK
jgi:CPA2 family monovalent cation:H+ antiporter-2